MMYPMTCVLVAALAVTSAAGCGGDDGGNPASPDAASPIDAAIDAPPGPLVGTWKTFDPLLTEAQKRTLTLGANGDLSLVRPDTTFQGTWDILPDQRLHTMMSTLSEAGSYYVSPDRLLTGAFQPSGPVSGLVGTWISHDNFASSENVRTLVTKADLTMTLSFVGTNTADFTGTYAFDGVRFALSTSAGDEFYLVAIPDVGIGQSLYERVTP